MKMFSNLDILNLPLTVKLKTCDLKIPTLSFSATASVPDCLDAHIMWFLLLCLKHPSSSIFFFSSVLFLYGSGATRVSVPSLQVSPWLVYLSFWMSLA